MAETIHGMDVSSHQPRNLSTLIAQYQVQHVIVRMYLPEETPPEAHSLAQVESARANGCTVGAYCWAYPSLEPRKTVQDAVVLARRCGMDPPPVLWIDCEDYLDVDHGPSVPWLAEAVHEAYRLGVEPGIYTGAWWWVPRTGNSAAFHTLPLWSAEYGTPHDLETWTSYGGWTHLSMKQYQGNPIDLNVCDPAVTGEVVVTDESRAYVQQVAQSEILRTLDAALALKLPKAAREALQYGAKPAAQTLADGRF